MQSQIPALARQLSNFVLLVSCAYLAAPGPGKKSKNEVRGQKDKRESFDQNRITPEVEEFMQLPPQIQRQVLDYAGHWIEANFERKD